MGSSLFNAGYSLRCAELLATFERGLGFGFGIYLRRNLEVENKAVWHSILYEALLGGVRSL